MSHPPKGNDLRVRRSKRLIQQAFLELLQEKNIADINVLEIAERAQVNRGTFYAHFSDKYVLLDTTIRDQFQTMLKEHFPSVVEWSNDSLSALIQCVLEYLQNVYHHCPPQGTMIPIFERAIQSEIALFLSAWLTATSDNLPFPEAVSIETFVWYHSWAILGAAIQWSQRKDVPSLDHITAEILALLVYQENTLKTQSVLQNN